MTKSSHHKTGTVLGVTVGTVAWVGVHHEVTSLTRLSFFGNDFPVSERFDHRLDIANGSTKVCNTKLGAGFISSDTLVLTTTAVEVIDQTTLLGKIL